MHCGFKRGRRKRALPNPRRPLLITARDVILDNRERGHRCEKLKWGSIQFVLATPTPALQHGALRRQAPHILRANPDRGDSGHDEGAS